MTSGFDPNTKTRIQSYTEGTTPNTERFTESGILVVNKPAGITSMDVCRVIRKVTRAKKVGHGGSLDPFATGVLPILLNRATKLSAQIMGGKKEYEGVMNLGVAYDTQDITGTPLGPEKEIPQGITKESLNKLAQNFVGEIQQTPPAYSAVKKDGRPLYDYARAGETIKVDARTVFVESFEFTEALDEKTWRFVARTSKGVYVRTLIHDFGNQLGCGAVLASLTRTQAGPFHMEESVELQAVKTIGDVYGNLKPVLRVV